MEYTSQKVKFKSYKNGFSPYIDKNTGTWWTEAGDTGIKAQGIDGIDGVSFVGVEEYYYATLATKLDENGSPIPPDFPIDGWETTPQATSFGKKDNSGVDYKYLWNVEVIKSEDAEGNPSEVSSGVSLLQIYTGGRVPVEYISYYAVNTSSTAPEKEPSLGTDGNSIEKKDNSQWTTNFNGSADANNYLFEITFIKYAEKDEEGKNLYHKVGPTVIGKNGANGAPARFLILSNESDVISKNKNGKIISHLPIAIQASITNSEDKLSIDNIDPPSDAWGDNGGDYYSYNGETGILSIKGIPDGFAEGKFRFEYSDTFKDFTLKVAQSEVDYNLVFDTTVINSSGADGSFNIIVKKTNSQGEVSDLYGPNEEVKIYKDGDASPLGSWTISFNKDTITPMSFVLKDTTGFEWDRQTIEFIKNGNNAPTTVITPTAQYFKSTTGKAGPFTPEYIYLYPKFQNTNYKNWQYSTDGGITWTGVSGANGLNIGTYSDIKNTLRIQSTSTLYTDAITSISFKCNTHEGIENVVSVAKIYDVVDLEIGGRNLLKNSDFMYEFEKGTHPGTQSIINLIDDYDIKELVNKTITFSYYVDCPGDRALDPDSKKDEDIRNMFGMHLWLTWQTVPDLNGNYETKSHGIWPSPGVGQTAVNTRPKKTQTLTPAKDETVTPTKEYPILRSIQVICAPYARPSDSNNATWKIGRPQLEIANTASDWTPALEELATPNIILTNENHQFRADESGVTQSETVTMNVTGFIGSTQIKTKIGSLINDTAALKCEIINNEALNTQIKFSVDSNLKKDSGTVKIPITIGQHKINKTFSWQRTKDGKNGTDGISFSGITEYYYATNDEKEIPVNTGNYWKTTPAEAGYGADKKYLWNYEMVSSSNGSTVPSTPYLLTTYGKDGANGRTPTKFISYYATSKTATAPPSPEPSLKDNNTKIDNTETAWTQDNQDLNAEDTGVYLWEKTFAEYDSSDAEGYNLYSLVSAAKIIGYNGTNGSSPFIISLTNDSEVVAANNEGEVLTGTTVKTKVEVYEGQTKVPYDAQDSQDKTFSCNNGDIGSFDSSTGELEINEENLKKITEDSKTFTFTWTNGSVTLTKDFTIKKIKSNADYDLVIDKNLFELSEETDKTVTIKVLKKDGAGSDYVYTEGIVTTSGGILTSEEENKCWKLNCNGITTLTPITITLTVNGIEWDKETIDFIKNSEKRENLLLKTYFGGENKTFTLPGTNTTGEDGLRFSPSQEITDTQVVLSFSAKINTDFGVYWIFDKYPNDLDIIFDKPEQAPTEYQNIVVTKTLPKDQKLTQVFLCTVWGKSKPGDWFEIKDKTLKLEFGSIPSAWDVAEKEKGTLFSFEFQQTNKEDNKDNIQQSKPIPTFTVGGKGTSFSDIKSAYDIQKIDWDLKNWLLTNKSGVIGKTDTQKGAIPDFGKDKYYRWKYTYELTYNGIVLENLELVETWDAIKEEYTEVLFAEGLINDWSQIVNNTGTALPTGDDTKPLEVTKNVWYRIGDAGIPSKVKLKDSKITEPIRYTRTIKIYYNDKQSISNPVIDNAISNIMNWCDSNNTALLDGEHIAASTVTAGVVNTNAIRSANYDAGNGTVKWTVVNGKITDPYKNKPESLIPSEIKDSNARYSTAGTFFDLNSGNIYSKNFSIVNGNASFRGHVEATSGKIGGMEILAIPEQIQQANTTANSAAGVAGQAKTIADTANTTANDAANVAGQANTIANAANATASGAAGVANQAKTAADSAVSTANTAGTLAGQAKTAADSAVSTAEGAQQKADEAVGVAGQAKTTADTANTAAKGASEAATLAKTTAEGAQQKAVGAEQKADKAQQTADAANIIANDAANVAGDAQRTANAAIPANSSNGNFRWSVSPTNGWRMYNIVEGKEQEVFKIYDSGNQNYQAVLNGTIYAKQGQIGGWNIVDKNLYLSENNPNNNIMINGLDGQIKGREMYSYNGFTIINDDGQAITISPVWQKINTIKPVSVTTEYSIKIGAWIGLDGRGDTLNIKVRGNKNYPYEAFTLWYNLKDKDWPSADETTGSKTVTCNSQMTNDEVAYLISEDDFPSSFDQISAFKISLDGVNWTNWLEYKSDQDILTYTYKRTTTSPGTSEVDGFCLSFSGSLIPNEDETYSLGSIQKKWGYINVKNAYTSSISEEAGTQTTSDQSLKNSIIPLTNLNKYSDLFDNIEPVVYKYNNGTSDRLHTGFISQQIKEAMDSVGLDSQDFAALTIENYDKPEEEQIWRLRYSEFIALNTDQIQKLKPRMSAAEQKLLDYEARIAYLEQEVAALKQ